MGNGHILGGRDLGARQVEVERFEIWPSVAMDVIEGGIMTPLSTHHVRIVVEPQRAVFLIPCDPLFLRTLGRQCLRAGGVSTPAQESEGQQHD